MTSVAVAHQHRMDRRRMLTDRIEFSDGGTGLAAAVAAALDCPQPVDAGVAESGDRLCFHLGPTGYERWASVTTPDGSVQEWPVAEIADRALSVVTRHRLDRAGRGLRLHAGAVADEGGRAVILVGRSGAGKSTMVAHLISAGRDLLTDEQLGLNPEDSGVDAFTRPIAIKHGGGSALPGGASVALPSSGNFLVAAAALGGRHRLRGLPSLVVLLDRRAGHPVETERLEAVEAVAALASQTLDLVVDPLGGLRCLTRLVAGAPVVRLRYPATDVGAVAIEDAAATQTPQASPCTVGVAAGLGPSGPGLCAAAAGTIHVDDGRRMLLYNPRTKAMVTLNQAAAAWYRELPGPVGAAGEDLSRLLIEHGMLV